MDENMFCVEKGELPLSKIDPTCGFAGIFHSVGVIGDSLASGEFESRDREGNILYHDMYEYSGPAVLQRITVAATRTFPAGG